MGTISFDRAGALRMMINRADSGVEIVAGRVQGLARSLAPVRKTGRADEKRNRAKPLPVGYFKQGTNERVAADLVLQRLQTAKVKRGESREQASRRIFTELDIELRLEPRKGQFISYQARADVARGSGVYISPRSGKAVFGGTLRRSIKVQSHKASGRRVRRTVKAGASYAKYVEFPTVRTKAQPFLLPAFKRFGTKAQLAKAMRR